MVSQVHNRCDGHSCVKNFKCELPLLNQLEKELVCIPCGWWLDREDCQYVVENIIKFLGDEKKIPRVENGIIIKFLSEWYIHEYFKLLFQLNNYEINMDTNEFKEKLDRMVFKQNSHIIILTDQGKIVATGKLLIEEKFYSNLGHIEDVIVDREYRGKNYGSKVIEVLTDLATKNNCYKIVLECNENTEKFYTKNNFVKKGFQMVKYLN